MHGNLSCEKVARIHVSAVTLALAALIMLPGLTLANYALVDCSGNTPGAFTSINTALSSLTPPDPNGDWIDVTGNCTESVNIQGRENLGIAALAGQSATIASPAGTDPVNISGSRSIYLYGLVIEGGNSNNWFDVFITNLSSVTIESCVIEGSVGEGVYIEGSSQLALYSDTLKNNGDFGLYVMENSNVVGQATDPNRLPDISNNAGGGINVDSRSAVNFWGGATIENNGGLGVYMSGGAQASFGGVQGNGVLIQGNNGGAYLFEDAEISFWGGGNTIQNNGPYGVLITMGSQVSFHPFGDSVQTVEGHTDVGIDISNHSQAKIIGHNKIRHNGSGGPASAGIRVDGTSEAIVGGGAEVTSNMGAGIFADENSSLDLSDTTISSNLGPGLRVLHQSVADLGTGIIMGGALACDHTSLVLSDLLRPSSGCPNVEPPGGPRRSHYMPTERTMRNRIPPKNLYQSLRKRAMHQ